MGAGGRNEVREPLQGNWEEVEGVGREETEEHDQRDKEEEGTGGRGR